MKVAYVFITPRAATYKLGQMILPQLEAGVHGVEVVGMFFFNGNTFILRKGDPIGERLAKVAREQNILLMMCDMCALERNLAKGQPRLRFLAALGMTVLLAHRLTCHSEPKARNLTSGAT